MSDNVSYELQQIRQILERIASATPVAPDVNVTVEGGGGGVSDGDKGALTVAGDVWTMNSVADPSWLTTLAWSKLTGVPSTFAPSSHTHPLSELTASGASTNDVATFDGTNWIPAAPSGGGGVVVNYWVATTTTTGSTTNILPIDDTIPQSSEGAEFMTVSVTPSSASNKLKVTVSGWYRVSGASIVGCALFVGSAANAVAARPLLASNVVVSPFDLVFWIDAFSGTETLRFRMGTDRNTVTFQFLNASSATYFGSTDPGMILVEEYAV